MSTYRQYFCLAALPICMLGSLTTAIYAQRGTARQESRAFLTIAAHFEQLAARGQEDAARQMAVTLRDRYAALPEGTKLEPVVCDGLIEALQFLGEEQLALEAGEAWLQWIAQDASYAERMTAEACATAIKFATTSQQQDALVEQAQNLLSAVGKVREGNLSPLELHYLHRVFVAANRDTLAAQAASFMQQCGWGNGRYPKTLTPLEISDLFREYSQRGDSQALSDLASFVAQEYMSQSGLLRVMRVEDSLPLIQIVVHAGDAATRKQMLHRLRSTIQEGILRVRGISPDVAFHLLRQLELLQPGSSPKALLARAWLGLSRDMWDSLPSAFSEKLAAAAFGDSRSRDALVRDAEARLEEKTLSLSEALALASLSWATPQMDRSQWGGHALSTFLALENPSISDLELFARLRSYGAPDLTAETAQALIEKIAAFDDVSWQISDATYKTLARFFDGEAQASEGQHTTYLPRARWQALLNQAMCGSHAEINLSIAKTLAWYYRDRRYIRPYLGRLERMQQHRELSADLQARWFIAQSYALGLVQKTDGRGTLGIDRVAKAVAMAQSGETKLLAARELAAVSRASGEYDKPVQILQSLKGQFPEDMQDAVSQMVAALEADRQTHVDALAQRADAKEHIREWSLRLQRERDQQMNAYRQMR
jgi:hypothetical protein